MRARHLVPILMIAVASGCMATYRVSPAEYVTQHSPSQILVMDNAGTIYLMDQPEVQGDTLVGVESGTPDSVSVPISQVEDALVKRPSKGRTMALIGGLAVGAGLAVTAVIYQGSQNPCKTGNNKPNQQDFVIGGSSQCAQTPTPDPDMP